MITKGKKMLNVEFKINGQVVGFMNIHNESTFADTKGNCIYSYRFVGEYSNLKGNNIVHKQSEGFPKLVKLCLDNIISKGEENDK